MTIGSWRKSSHSGDGGSQCVETRLHHDRPRLSDSKLSDNRPILDLDRDTYTGLLSMIKDAPLPRT